MNVYAKVIDLPPPPKTIVIEMSEAEARKFMAWMGNQCGYFDLFQRLQRALA